MIKTDELSINAKGGTELLKERLHKYLEIRHPEALENIDFYFSRVRDFDENTTSVYYLHDLPGDPETQHLKACLYDFDAKVFVSWWQLEQYRNAGLISTDEPNNIVIPNSIPLQKIDFNQCLKKWDKQLGTKDNPVRLIYHTTPHRGLQILIPVFEQLYEKFLKKNIYITLDVYSSFKIYGWEQRDIQYQELFKRCKDHPVINYYGSVSNEEILNALEKTHIFAFPSIWQESSCISLIEAMATGNKVVHSSLAALPETSGGYTDMYPYVEDLETHTKVFTIKLEQLITQLTIDKLPELYQTHAARKHVEYNHSWFKNQFFWTKLINQLT